MDIQGKSGFWCLLERRWKVSGFLILKDLSENISDDDDTDDHDVHAGYIAFVMNVESF